MGKTGVMGQHKAAVAFWPATRDSRIASYRLRCLLVIDGLCQLGQSAQIYRPCGQAPDILVLTKRYDRGSLAHALELRARYGTRVILDLCDNHFYNPRNLPDWAERARQLREAVLASDLVTTASAELALRVGEAVGSTVPLVVIPDTVERPIMNPPVSVRPSDVLAEMELLRIRRELSRDRPNLIWFGNASSPYADGGMADLARIAVPLQRVARSLGASLTVVSNSAESWRRLAPDLDIPSRYVTWRSRSFSRILALHDVALIPVSANPFTLCKSANRVATAFLHGVAVAADPIPSYMDYGNSALLGDWESGFDELVAHPGHRQERVCKGAAFAQASTDLAVIAGQWQRLFRTVLRN